MVFHRDHWSRILSVILNMKNIYFRKHNTRLVNPKQRAVQWIYIYIYIKWNEMNYCYGGFVHLIVIVIQQWYHHSEFLSNCYASYAYHIYISILIDEDDRTAVGYVCLWEGTSSESKFLHLFNACYHMVGRSSEVSLSRFGDIKMENVNDNNGSYDVAMQGIERSKQEPIRNYVYILRKNVFFTTGTGPWHTHAL